MQLRAGVLFLLTTGALLAGCGPSAAERDLREARALWRAQALDSYLVDVNGADGCTDDCITWRVRVDGGEVASIAPAPGQPARPTPTDTSALTIEGVFAQVEEVLEHTENVEVEYDHRTGVPRWISGYEEGLGEIFFSVERVLPVPGAAEAGAHDCAGPPGSPIDVAGGPAWSSWADLWTTAEGCLVRGDLITSFAGPSHCGWESARMLVTGEPFGELLFLDGSFPRLVEGIWYIRDPGGVIGDPALVAGFDPDAQLPAGAIDTGLRQGGDELWIVEGDASAVYLRGGEGIERWPRDRDVVLCA